jgi:hypothetical protein
MGLMGRACLGSAAAAWFLCQNGWLAAWLLRRLTAWCRWSKSPPNGGTIAKKNGHRVRKKREKATKLRSGCRGRVGVGHVPTGKRAWARPVPVRSGCCNGKTSVWLPRPGALPRWTKKLIWTVYLFLQINIQARVDYQLRTCHCSIMNS